MIITDPNVIFSATAYGGKSVNRNFHLGTFGSNLALGKKDH